MTPARVRRNEARRVGPLTPWQFENQCADTLREIGWFARVTSLSGDQGIDIVADKLGCVVVIQCKLYSRPVGSRAVQEAAVGLIIEKAHYAAVVSNASYTAQARRMAKSANVKLLAPSDLERFDKIFGLPEGDAVLLEHAAPKAHRRRLKTAVKWFWITSVGFLIFVIWISILMAMLPSDTPPDPSNPPTQSAP